MEKKLIRTTVFQKISVHGPILWKHLKSVPFEDDDQLDIGWIEPWENGSDNSGGGYHEAVVYRMLPESDEEFEKRCKRAEEAKAFGKKLRQEQYLKLKEEFENG